MPELKVTKASHGMEDAITNTQPNIEYKQTN